MLNAADLVTLTRAVAGVALPVVSRSRHLSLALFLWGVVSDWLDGPLARRLGPTSRGRWLDCEADSLLTLGAAIASDLTPLVLVAPLARYVIVPIGREDRRWDRITGVAQMVVFAMSFLGLRTAARRLSMPIALGRCAYLLSTLRGHKEAPVSGGLLVPSRYERTTIERP